MSIRKRRQVSDVSDALVQRHAIVVILMWIYKYIRIGFSKF